VFVLFGKSGKDDAKDNKDDEGEAEVHGWGVVESWESVSCRVGGNGWGEVLCLGVVGDGGV